MALWKFELFTICQQDQKVFELGAWKIRLPDQIFEKKNHHFFGVAAHSNFGHFKLVSKMSQKLFQLGAWNLVNW